MHLHLCKHSIVLLGFVWYSKFSCFQSVVMHVLAIHVHYDMCDSEYNSMFNGSIAHNHNYVEEILYNI